MKLYILLKAYWYFSQNAGEECANDVVEVFKEKKDLDKYLIDNDIELEIIYEAYKIPRIKEATGTEDKEYYFVTEANIFEP